MSTNVRVDQQSPTTDRVFTLFRKLPPELRLKIWELAIFPRTVTIGPNPVNHGGLIRLQEISPGIPSIFHVNRESRAVAFPKYTFHNSFDVRAIILFNFEQDTLAFTHIVAFFNFSHPLQGSQSPTDQVFKSKVKKLRLSMPDYPYMRKDEGLEEIDPFRYDVLQFTSLQEFNIMRSPSHEQWSTLEEMKAKEEQYIQGWERRIPGRVCKVKFISSYEV